MKTFSRIHTRAAGLLVASALTASALVISPSAESAEASPKEAIKLSKSLRSVIRADMADAGITTGTQARLIADIEDGNLPDSFAGGQPVTTFTELTETAEQTVSVFADGSRQVLSIERPNPHPTRTGISGCSNSGSWRVNCKVEIKDLISSARFTVDYQTSGSQQAKVRDFRGATCANGLGSCSLPNPKGIARATQTSAGPAWARLSFKADAGPVHASGEFGIRVSGTTASAY